MVLGGWGAGAVPGRLDGAEVDADDFGRGIALGRVDGPDAGSSADVKDLVRALEIRGGV